MNRRQLLAGASAAALATALPAGAAIPQAKSFAAVYGAGNPFWIMQRFLEANGFTVDSETFGAGIAYCEEPVVLQTNSTAEADDIGDYLKAILV